jgi:UDP-N-acetylglucosamine/UDP-N-acetylgalactosamine diphosphorylase
LTARPSRPDSGSDERRDDPAVPGRSSPPAAAAKPSERPSEPEERLRAAGQSHLLEHAATLPGPEARAFVAECAALPWEEVAAALRPTPPAGEILRPPETLTLRRQRNEPGYPLRLAEKGREALARGEVAALLLAGGQGTRLGHPGPKGTFVLGPEPDRTLYAVLAERVAATGRRAGRPVPLVVLVSGDTEEGTREDFARTGHHGLDPADVSFVRQGELPAVDDEGRALLAAPGRLALAPDGHGGALEALGRAGLLASLAARGVRTLVTFQVDNPLGRPLDPVFLGWMAERRAFAAGKAVRARSPSERVGVFARDGRGRLRVVEYIERPPEGLPPELVLGSIAVHAFSLALLAAFREAGGRLPLHRARKRVPHLGPDGSHVQPTSADAWKVERFLFDLFPHAPRATVHEVDRRREFAPVKDAQGEDGPDAARAAVAAEVARWHREAGRPPPEVPSLRPLEIDG